MEESPLQAPDYFEKVNDLDEDTASVQMVIGVLRMNARPWNSSVSDSLKGKTMQGTPLRREMEMETEAVNENWDSRERRAGIA